jgi:hypothetical protein
MALMAAHGELPMPDCAIFADTGWEPQSVYRHLDRLEAQLPFPVHRVSAGNLRDDILRGYADRSRRFASVPWFIQMPDGSVGMGRRQCTAHYKLEPINRQIVALLGGRPRGGCELWTGISTDEAHRMRPSRVRYVVNRWPLVDARLSRADCRAWLARRGYDAPKSSCKGCPYHSAAQWRDAMADPAERAELIEMDRIIRRAGSKGIEMRGEQFMHRSMRPLAEIDFSTWAERGQRDLFGEECTGICGTVSR